MHGGASGAEVVRQRLVMTAFNRPTYFRDVCDSWWRARHFEAWHPRVHLEPSVHAAEMAVIAVGSGWNVTLNAERHGVLHNPWTAFDAAFTDGADFVVLAEDDVVVSDDVLEYFDWAAESYRDEPDVLAACAWTQATGEHLREDVGGTQTGFSPLVWGTWRDRWEGILRDTWDHDYSTGENGQHAGWDWNINLRVGHGSKFVYPEVTRSDHIGEYGGIHMTSAMFHTSRAPAFTSHHEPQQWRRA